MIRSNGSNFTGWLYKTQFIRAAPHHVRADILGPQHLMDDLQSATNQVRTAEITWRHKVL